MGPSLGKGEQKLLTSEEGQKLSAATFSLPSGPISVTDILCASGKVTRLHPSIPWLLSILPPSPPPAQDPAFAQAAETAASAQPELGSSKPQ